MKFTNTKTQFNTVKADAKVAFEANSKLVKSTFKLGSAVYVDLAEGCKEYKRALELVRQSVELVVDEEA